MKSWLARLWFPSPRSSAGSRHRIPLRLEQLEDRLAPAVITVTSNGDTIAIDGLATLREAITSINNQADINGDVTLNRVGGYASTPGGTPDVINFSIFAVGVNTISATAAEPTIIRPLTIDGYSQAGASANTLANADNAVILIQLDGTGAGTNVNGLTLGAASGGSTIKGLDITNFQADANLNGGVGIFVQSNGNAIVGNFVGVNPAGTTPMANGGDGIRVVNASNNMIGSTNPADRNVASGNALDGIHVEGTIATPATGNLIQGNFVGVAADGKSSLLAASGPQPTGITLGADGNLWFTESANNAIGRITTAGVVTEFSLAGLQAGSGPIDIVSDPANNLLYFTEKNVGRVGSINPLAGSDAAILASETQSVVVPSGAGAGVSGITLGPDGNLWFTEVNVDRVGNITPNLATGNEFSTGITPGAAPENIVTGADGALWFTEFGNAVGRITTAGAVTEFSLAALGVNNGPIDIVSDPANNLLYFTLKNVGTIGRINPLATSDALILASETQSAVVPSGAGAGVSGITLGPDGNLWFTEANVDRVANINPTLTTINEFSTGITPGAVPSDIVSVPTDNALWFTEFGNNAIGRITTGGTVTNEFHPPSAFTGQGNKIDGIEISGGNLNTVGGTAAGARNVVGFNGAGIEVDNGGQSNIIQGNFSGVGADGTTAAGNLQHGIALRSSNGLSAPLGPAQANEPGVSFNLIGGTAAGAGNLVEFNGAAGVAVFGNPVSASGQPNIGNAIEGNSLFENGRPNPTFLLGIDLTNHSTFPEDDGLTPNDSKGHGTPNDPNNFQNFPVLTAAVPDNGKTDITGTLKSTPGSTFRIEFFASNTDPARGIPEGQQFLGFVNATADANGNAPFSVSLNVPVAVGRIVTGTATDGIGNTSEFSAGIFVGTRNQAFVIKVYHDLLGRQPDPNGLAGWSGLLDQGVPRSQVVLEIENDAAHEYYTDLVQSFYQLYLKRAEGPGDGNGPANMVNFLAAGGTVEQLRAGFTSSAEYFSTRAGGTSSGFINALYLDAFNTPNRLTSDPGAQSFKQQLDNGTLNRAQVSAAIFSSTEFEDDLEQGFYTQFLNRSGSSGELNAWASQLAAGATDQFIIAQILGSLESFQKA
jgi:streptogramin lyase